MSVYRWGEGVMKRLNEWYEVSEWSGSLTHENCNSSAKPSIVLIYLNIGLYSLNLSFITEFSSAKLWINILSYHLHLTFHFQRFLSELNVKNKHRKKITQTHFLIGLCRIKLPGLQNKFWARKTENLRKILKQNKRTERF